MSISFVVNLIISNKPSVISITGSIVAIRTIILSPRKLSVVFNVFCLFFFINDYIGNNDDQIN